MRIKINVADGKNVFFISDFHLFHKNVVRFDGRPFVTETGEADLDAMHAALLANWNEVVRPNDVVFYMGDLAFGKLDLAKEFVHQLNGEIHFIMGNHDDYKEIVKMDRFKTINDLVDLNIVGSTAGKNLHFVVCHFPIYSWNRESHGSYHPHGHTHGNLHHGDTSQYYINRNVIDVGCNVIDYTPISYLKIIDKFKKTT